MLPPVFNDHFQGDMERADQVDEKLRPHCLLLCSGDGFVSIGDVHLFHESGHPRFVDSFGNVRKSSVSENAEME